MSCSSAAGAVRDDGTSRAYVREGYPAVPDTELLLALTESIRAQGFAHRLGIIRSHESFYIDDIEEINEYWSKKGVLGSDMETAALLTVGRLRGHEMRERAQQRRALEGVHFPRRRLLRRRRPTRPPRARSTAFSPRWRPSRGWKPRKNRKNGNFFQFSASNPSETPNKRSR